MFYLWIFKSLDIFEVCNGMLLRNNRCHFLFFVAFGFNYRTILKPTNSSWLIVLSFVNSHFVICDLGLPVVDSHSFLNRKYIITTIITFNWSYRYNHKFWNKIVLTLNQSFFLHLVIALLLFGVSCFEPIPPTHAVYLSSLYTKKKIGKTVLSHT